MNCDEFNQLMNQRLDDRLPITNDRQLLAHADQCESCLAQLEAWRQIASVLPVETTWAEPSRNRKLPFLKLVAGLAAVLLFAIGFSWGKHDTVASVDVNQSQDILTPIQDMDPMLWWREVQDRDWVGQTMPMVESVQRGVAPLGRSLMRAATILTIGGPNQTS